MGSRKLIKEWDKGLRPADEIKENEIIQWRKAWDNEGCKENRYKGEGRVDKTRLRGGGKNAIETAEERMG